MGFGRAVQSHSENLDVLGHRHRRHQRCHTSDIRHHGCSGGDTGRRTIDSIFEQMEAHRNVPPFFVKLSVMRREIWPVVGAGVLLIGAHLLPVPQNGTLAGTPTICPVKILTGWPCPGCGITRSLIYCAHGDWRQAFAFHPLGPTVYALLWLILIAGVLQLRRKPQHISQRALVFASSTFGAALLISWALRLFGILPYPANF